MVSINIGIAARSFAVCVLEGLFNSKNVYDPYDQPVYPREITMSRDCSANIYLDLMEAKKLADKLDKLIPTLSLGYAKHLRDKQWDLLRQIWIVERGEAPIEKPIKKPETPPAWMLEIDPEL